MTGVGRAAFSDCTNLTSIALPHSLTSVGPMAFSNCTRLSSLTLPATLTAVEEYSFRNCQALSSLTLPFALTDFGRGAFSFCEGLTSLVFRPRVSCAFIAWAVGSMRSRTNWQVTCVKQMRNILRLITIAASERRDVANVGPHGAQSVFEGCVGLDDVVDIGRNDSADTGW